MVQPQTIVLFLNFITSVSSGFPRDRLSRNLINGSLHWGIGPSFSFMLGTTPFESGSVSISLAIGHLYLIESSLSGTISTTLKFCFWLFHFCLLPYLGKFFHPSCPKSARNVLNTLPSSSGIDIWSWECFRWWQNNISFHSEKLTWW